jgi:hypothetical protein
MAADILVPNINNHFDMKLIVFTVLYMGQVFMTVSYKVQEVFPSFFVNINGLQLYSF